MNPSNSIPPEEAASIRAQLRALSLQVEGLTRLLLGLEAAIRELLGTVKAYLDHRAAELAREAQPGPVSTATVGLLQNVGADPTARAWIGRAIAFLLASIGVWLLAHAEIAPQSPLTGIFSLMDHYISPGKVP